MIDAEFSELIAETNAAIDEFNRLVELLRLSRGASFEMIQEIKSKIRVAETESNSLSEKYNKEAIRRNEIIAQRKET